MSEELKPCPWCGGKADATLREVRDGLGVIANRPDLPNPDRDADWKNCQKNSSYEAKKLIAKLDKLIGGGK